MVASPHARATLAGVEVLRSGGTAVDAAVAVGALLGVAQPNQTGIGGDAFWLLRPRGGPTLALNASGRTPAGVDPSAIRSIPPRSALAVTVPGTTSAWAAAHERFGRLDYERLLAPAVEAAEDGLPVTPLLARALRGARELLGSRPESARVFCPGGRPPAVGERLRQPDLARTLRALARDPQALYRGELAGRVAAALAAEGSTMTAADLAEHRADWVEPVAHAWRGLQVEEVPPNSQGLAVLLVLALLDAGPPPRDALERAQRTIAASRLALAVRDAELGDPASMRRTPAELLAAAAAGTLAPGVPRAATPARGDTVYYAVVDADGLAVSCIQSVFQDFGSGLVVPDTGILLHNRGCELRPEPGHVNSLEPRKRPLHTLTAGLATEDGATAIVFGTMGGHAQAQIHVQLLQALVEDGLDPATAVDLPRFFAPPGAGRALVVEAGHPLADGLAGLGEQLVPVERYDPTLGHAHALVVDEERGVLVGAADPRSDGLALGY